MLQVNNDTPFKAGIFLFPDRDGIDTLYPVLKATFEIGERGGVRISAEQRPIVPTDEHWDAPGESSIKYAGEAHLEKPATDIALVGHGYPEGGRPAEAFTVSLAVGKVRKILHVSGDRTWKRGPFGLTPSSPQPAERIPLTYDRAFGGPGHPRNPVGRGFRGREGGPELDREPVPNIEDPAHLISTAKDRPPPAGVGFIAPSWQPRLAYGGTYDDEWQKHRAPYLPRDFDPRFFQAATPDLVYPGFLSGGEPVAILNACPTGTQRFDLPRCELRASARIAGQDQPIQMRLETLLLEPDQYRLSITFRGAIRCDKRALRIERVQVAVASMQGVQE